MSSTFADVSSKIERADKHIRDFVIHAGLFLKPDPYGIVVESDPNTGQKFHVVKRVPAIPRPLRIIAGDALQNLRSALDYLAYGLVVANKAKPTRDTGFPISKSVPTPEDPKSSFARQVRGIRQEAIEAIKSTKPYKGGDDTLWRLHRLNVIDKHRLLIAATTAVSHINPRFSADLSNYLIGASDAIPNPATTLLERFPVKTGDKFPVYSSKPQVNQYEQFMLEIAFNEPGVSEGEVIIAVPQTIHPPRREDRTRPLAVPVLSSYS